ncbi:hypothetical protein ACFO9E_14915 [Streptomyces maoxianensis]|uniref:Uncharacterized protein n=1 Tax=Streptomyces maoxianensis TaxID=1459942 RepID=A0ABV9G469_9ACTN
MPKETQERDDWRDNTHLNAWLTERKESFPAWAAEADGGWDFSLASLAQLVNLVLGVYRSYEEMQDAAQKADPFLAGAVWYLGEVQIRSSGAAWHCRPEPDHTPLQVGDPFIRMPEDPEHECDDECDEYDDDHYVPSATPFDQLARLLLLGPDHRLQDDLLTGP